jgi:transposase
VKTKEQQATLIVHRTRELLVGQRVVLTNALRGYLAEFGIVAARGNAGTNRSLEAVQSREIPSSARPALCLLKQAIELLRKQIADCEDQIGRRHASDAKSLRLATIPHIGPITASAFVATVGNARRFCSARQFAAWLGLVPKQSSTGGKQKLGRISKRGNPYLRRLLFLAATAGLRDTKFARTSVGAWAASLRARKPYRLAVIALAARLARIIWALLVRQRDFEPYPGRLAGC